MMTPPFLPASKKRGKIKKPTFALRRESFVHKNTTAFPKWKLIDFKTRLVSSSQFGVN